MQFSGVFLANKLQLRCRLSVLWHSREAGEDGEGGEGEEVCQSLGRMSQVSLRRLMWPVSRQFVLLHLTFVKKMTDMPGDRRGVRDAVVLPESDSVVARYVDFVCLFVFFLIQFEHLEDEEDVKFIDTV